MSTLKNSVVLSFPRKIPTLSLSKKMKQTFKRGVGLLERKPVTNVFETAFRDIVSTTQDDPPAMDFPGK